jgi:hypothetical protein
VPLNASQADRSQSRSRPIPAFSAYRRGEARLSGKGEARNHLVRAFVQKMENAPKHFLPFLVGLLLDVKQLSGQIKLTYALREVLHWVALAVSR